jgi:hypothetical protein
MHALIDDDFGRLTVRRLRPWHRMLARGLAARLDRELADGARPEASAVLAARALVLTSIGYRRGLAASLRRILAAAVSPETRPRLLTASRSAGAARQPYVPLLAERGPVPARGVAMVSHLLADGGGPLYRADSRDDLGAVIERASQALIS